jgi:hypothetical protein
LTGSRGHSQNTDFSSSYQTFFRSENEKTFDTKRKNRCFVSDRVSRVNEADMDTMTLIIIGGLAIIAIAATLYALNRSWGSFPKDARYQPRTGTSAPGISPSASTPPGSSTLWDDRPSAGEILASPLEAPEPASWRVPITHPFMRRAAEQALQRGDATARYIVRQGDQLAFDFSQISDPAQRRQAYAVMRRFADGENVDIGAMMQVMRELFKTY